MAFVISDLLKDWPCTWLQGSFNKKIKSVKADSREVQVGDVFIVIQGKKTSGANYIKEAIQRGAVCIISEKREHLKECPDVAFGMVPNTRTFFSHACSRIYTNPSDQLHIVAVTGTNGKTTVSHMIGQILTMLGIKTAVIGTLGLYIGGKKVEGDFPSLTTWSPYHLHSTFAMLLSKNITHVIIEASSMGLAQHRLDSCTIQQGVFLNIGQDHIEDHQGFTAYKKAKCRLLHLANKLVINEDDSFWLEMGKQSDKEIKWFGNHQIELYALQPFSMDLIIHEEIIEYPLKVQFTGTYNISNIAASIATIRQMGIPLTQIIEVLPHLTLPAGRFQCVVHEPFQVVIDYAHTPEALQHLLASAAQITKGRLIVVFGCGGERDKSKRSQMGEIANFYAQSIWVTSDNPRSENPLKICQHIIQDLPPSHHIHIEIDRATAIEKALRSAQPGDLLCIAGKGHESTQHIGTQVVPFSDEETVRRILSSFATSRDNEK